MAQSQHLIFDKTLFNKKVTYLLLWEEMGFPLTTNIPHIKNIWEELMNTHNQYLTKKNLKLLVKLFYLFEENLDFDYDETTNLEKLEQKVMDHLDIGDEIDILSKLADKIKYKDYSKTHNPIGFCLAKDFETISNYPIQYEGKIKTINMNPFNLHKPTKRNLKKLIFHFDTYNKDQDDEYKELDTKDMFLYGMKVMNIETHMDMLNILLN